MSPAGKRAGGVGSDVRLAEPLAVAVAAARAAGALMRRQGARERRVNSSTQHDIKLELDVKCQKLIERRLGAAYPGVPILGEEGIEGDVEAPYRWVVDPIDGTVNFAYGIPHACVSIALEAATEGGHESVVGVVYDPFCDELWTAFRGGVSRLNGRPIRVSGRVALRECIISLGFAKYRRTLNEMVPVMNALIHRVRKIRITGSAALSLVYVATGRFDAYVEAGLRLWDIAAGGLIVRGAGGEFSAEPLKGPAYSYRMAAGNFRLLRRLRRVFGGGVIPGGEGGRVWRGGTGLRKRG